MNFLKNILKEYSVDFTKRQATTNEPETYVVPGSLIFNALVYCSIRERVYGDKIAASEKKDLPVEDSPAMAVILFPEQPPNILPETSPLKMYEPVSTKVSVSSMSDASWV